MLLPAITEAIKKAPKHITGLSFSDRSVRFVEVERHKDDVLTISGYGQLTIPYDVVEGGRVVNMVEFAETMRRLNNSIHPDSKIIMRQDNDPLKIDALSYAGFTNVSVKKGIDSLRGVFVPWEADARRICIFANFDATYVLAVTGYETTLLQKISKQELFTPGTGEVLRSFLENTTDNRILLAGKYADESFEEQLSIYGLAVERTNIWKNLFDFSVYIPEIPQDESYHYTVPAGLLVAGLMKDVTEPVVDRTASKDIEHKKPKKKKQTSSQVATKSQLRKKEKISHEKPEETGSLEDIFWDVEPLTKLEEDKRKASEKKMSKKYTKHL